MKEGLKLPARLYSITDDENILSIAEACMDWSDTIDDHKMTMDDYVELLRLEIKKNNQLTDEARCILNDKQVIKAMEDELAAKPDYKFETEFRYRMMYQFLNDKDYVKKLKEYPDEE